MFSATGFILTLYFMRLLPITLRPMTAANYYISDVSVDGRLQFRAVTTAQPTRF
jgi:hypothetical protein